MPLNTGKQLIDKEPQKEMPMRSKMWTETKQVLTNKAI